jgi:MFS family permease
MRLTLFGATAAGVVSAVAPNLGVLIAARALAGGLFAAVIPAALVYVGDTVGMDSRQKALADLMAASAVGTALATALGGSPPTSMPGGLPSRPRPSPEACSHYCWRVCQSQRTSRPRRGRDR